MEFAPLWVPWRRRLQTFGILWYIWSFLYFGLLCTSLFFYLTLFTRLWPLTLLYSIYYFYDWNTPENGGRPFRFMKNLIFWKWMADYFPLFAHKTVELDPKRNYILACHPHGVLCPGAFASTLVGDLLIGELFPKFNIRLSMLNFWFRIPFFRDYIMSGGLTMVTKAALRNMLKKFREGFLLAIIPGGAEEALLARPGDIKIILRSRMGFIKLAKTTGTAIVPCFSFGDHACWDQEDNPKGSRLRNFQDKLLDIFGMSLPLFNARGIFQYVYGQIPRRGALHFYVGKPIEIEKNENPSSEELVELQKLYEEKLIELFNEHKSKYLVEGTKLVIT